MTKQNSPLGKVMWYDGEFYHSHTVNNETYPLWVQVGGGPMSRRKKPLRGLLQVVGFGRVAVKKGPL